MNLYILIITRFLMISIILLLVSIHVGVVRPIGIKIWSVCLSNLFLCHMVYHLTNYMIGFSQELMLRKTDNNSIELTGVHSSGFLSR